MKRVPNLHALFEASPYPYLLFDKALIIIGANAEYLRATSSTAEQIIGKYLFDAFPPNPNDPDSTNMDAVRRSIAIAISTKAPHTSALLRYAVPDAGTNPGKFIEKIWSAIHSPVLDENGEVAFISQNPIDATHLYNFNPASQRYSLKSAIDLQPEVADISRQQLHEAMTRVLKAERTQLQLLFNQAPGFIAIFTGKDHVFEVVNEAYYRLVGQRELIGKSVMEALPEIEGQGFKELLDRTFATGEPAIMKQRKGLLRRKSTGGLSETYMDLLYQPIFADDGSVTGIFAQGHDVTAEFQAQQQLAEKIDQLEGVKNQQDFQLRLSDLIRKLSLPIEIFSAACISIGDHFKVSRVVCGEYDSATSQAIVHSKYPDGAASELDGNYIAAILRQEHWQSLRSGEAWISDDLSTDLRVSGKNEWSMFRDADIYSVIAVPLSNQGSILTFIFLTCSVPRVWKSDEIVLVKDSAERMWTAVVRVRAESALKLSDKRKDQFLAMLAHELRNPLAPISAAAELLNKENIKPDIIQKASAVITRQVRHITGLVDDLLDVSRVSSGLVVLEKERVELSRVIDESLEQLRPSAEAKKQTLSIGAKTHSVFIEGDFKRLVQIFSNLIHNAVKYTPTEGRIFVESTIKDGHVYVSVRDDGIGIAEELLPNIFELFVQGKRSNDRAQGGLGLGLSIVKSLVELHDGNVRVVSAGRNAGSTFTVGLPVVSSNQDLSEISDPTEAPRDIEQGLSILVVDDNTDAADMLGIFLTELGFQVTVEYDPFKALALAISQPFDVFLFDIGLPGMDGNQLALRVRNIPIAKDALMVAITGYGSGFDRESALSASFNEFLVKPASPTKIVALIKAFFG